MRVFLLVLCFVAACAAQERCCVPDLHTIREVKTTSRVENGRSVSDDKYAELAADYYEQRFGEEAEVRYEDGTTERYKVIELIQEDARYFIQDDKCTKEKPQETHLDRCVSEFANYTGSFFIGDHQMECDQWSEDIRDDEAQGFLTSVFTRGNCVPFSTAFSGVIKREGSEPQQELTVSVFNDFRKGIDDPDRWFVPPSFCP